MDQFFGRVVDLVHRVDGDELTADAAAGATVLSVGDTTDFDEDGGLLLMIGATDPIAYETCDADAATITLTDPLIDPAAEGDLVQVYDDELGTVVTEHVAHVLLDDQDTDDEPVEVTVPHYLVDYLEEAVRGGAAEAVTLIRDGEDDLTISDVGGKPVVDIAVEELAATTDDKLAALNVDLDNLNGVTLPQLQADLDANEAAVGTLQGKFPITSTSISDGAITTPKMTANSINGDRIIANTLNASKIVANSISVDKMAANSVGADQIIANSIGADQITANAIDGMTITGATVRTASTGKRIELTTAGRINFYDSSNNAAGFVEGTGTKEVVIQSDPLNMWASFVRVTPTEVIAYTNSGDITLGGTVGVTGRLNCSDQLHGKTLWADSVNTTSDAANVNIGTGGQLFKSTSSRRYKKSIRNANLALDAVLGLRPRSWVSRAQGDGDKRYVGLVAEEVHAAGLTDAVVYDSDGRPDSLSWPAITTHLIGLVQQQQRQIESLTKRMTKLEARA